jgi:ATP-dependent exoDNAse (exonuclease V) alpha subunit
MTGPDDKLKPQDEAGLPSPRPVSIGAANRAALQAPPRQKPVIDGPSIEITPEYERILDWLNQGAPLVFVTGKAGTGKTTLVRFLKERFTGNAVVVAPTGVAALQVGGVTIHSFFRFPPRVVLDEDIRLVRDRKLYSRIQLLIIDEVSMVRADLVDAIDKFLRLNRERDEPFGGCQVLMIGDLFQLPPVVNGRDREALNLLGYESPWFFSAKSLQACQMLPIELGKVYRQTDAGFVDLLNQVRLAESCGKFLPVLNARYDPEESPDPEETIVTLACTNHVVDSLNDRMLRSLDEPPHRFEGKVSGKFVVEDEKLPSPINLTIKAGAQVMFTKNDGMRRWVNGTLGRVAGFDQDANGLETVRVEVGKGHEKTVVEVKQVKWDSYRYVYDRDTDSVGAETTGDYVQYPLMLAWAVTIHKSQGKTLDKVRLDLGSGAFDYGQVYVALSRARSLEDIRLARPIHEKEIKADPVIKRFYSAMRL